MNEIIGLGSIVLCVIMIIINGNKYLKEVFESKEKKR